MRDTVEDDESLKMILLCSWRMLPSLKLDTIENTLNVSAAGEPNLFARRTGHAVHVHVVLRIDE